MLLALLIAKCACIGSNSGYIGVNAAKYAAKNGNRVVMELSWNAADAATFYRIYRRKSGEEWSSISTFNYSSPNSKVRVLNAYPMEHASCSGKPVLDQWRVLNAKFVYSDGSSSTMPKSSALKVWMEGGSIDGVTFDRHGRNPLTNEQAIEVSMIPIDDLDKQPEMIWNYDVVVFGIWDASGARDYNQQNCNFPETGLINELKRYLDCGFGVIASHDAIGRFSGPKFGLGVIKDRFGIKVGGRTTASENDKDANNQLMTALWRWDTTSIAVTKRGMPVDFPWKLPSTDMIIPLTHTYGNLATSDVWVQLSGDTIPKFPHALHDNEDPLFYLTTKNNTAMIQTGHSECNSSFEERNLWANLIYFMKQRTTDTRILDYSNVDEDPPHNPTCHCETYGDGEYFFRCESTDHETLYQYLIEGYNDNGAAVGNSGFVSINVASGVDHFRYYFDQSKTKTQNELLQNGKRLEKHQTLSEVHPNEAYLHVLTVDACGNPSDVVTYDLSHCFLLTADFKHEVKQRSSRRITVYTLVYTLLY